MNALAGRGHYTYDSKHVQMDAKSLPKVKQKLQISISDICSTIRFNARSFQGRCLPYETPKAVLLKHSVSGYLSSPKHLHKPNTLASFKPEKEPTVQKTINPVVIKTSPKEYVKKSSGKLFDASAYQKIMLNATSKTIDLAKESIKLKEKPKAGPRVLQKIVLTPRKPAVQVRRNKPKINQLIFVASDNSLTNNKKDI